MEALPIGGWQYTVDFHQIFPDLAAKYNVPLVPFLLTGVIGNPDLMSSDGVHPNAAGAKVMAQNIWPYLKQTIEAVVARG
jgi:acyl-CoA thioesterase-1